MIMAKRQNTLIPQTTHVVSTLVVVATIALMLLTTSPARSAGAPAADLPPAAVDQPLRIRRSSEYGDRELAYGAPGEPMNSALDKRIGRLASWGKKSDASWLDRAASKAIRSKWSNSNMAVWGKRMPPPELIEKRGKWSGNNMAVWG